MYLKIRSYHTSCLVSSGRPEMPSKPKVIYPCYYIYDCRKVVIMKSEVDGYQSYCDFINPLLEVSNPPIEILGGDPNVAGELLEILLTDKSGIDQRIVAIDVEAFLMNDDGKTVDRWHCDARSVIT